MAEQEQLAQLVPASFLSACSHGMVESVAQSIDVARI